MLRVSKLTDYSTVIMAYMARHPDDVFSVAETAVAVGVAPPTASKILKMLARAGLVQSRRGTRGGYSLARPPMQISIAELIEAMEGSLGVTECSATAGLCLREGQCHIRDHWQDINQLILHTLGQVTLADLAHARPLQQTQAQATEPFGLTRLPLPIANARSRHDSTDIRS